MTKRWTAVFGQVAVGSFVVLSLSGLYLEFFFDPSMATTVYDGPYDNLRGVEVSRAYDSALAISFEVRGGLFVRQLHNWAASLFVAALLARLVVGFFSGRFRRWAGGVALLFVGVMAAFTGVLLPDDLMSGTSLRMISGYLLSIPVAGTWLHWALFGGEFPGTGVIPRLHVVHLVLAVVIAVGLARQLWVRLATRSLPLLTATAGVLALMAATMQVNAIWAYGPANPSHVSGGATSPWYFGWVDGAVRLWPAWEIRLGDYTIAPWFWPSMVFLPVSFVVLALYPWFERRLHIPHRTALGVSVITFYVCLQLSAAIDILTFTFHLDANAVFWSARVGVFVLPTVAYLVARRIQLGLRLAGKAVLEHGVETGRITRLATGGYVEGHERPRQLTTTG